MHQDFDDVCLEQEVPSSGDPNSTEEVSDYLPNSLHGFGSLDPFVGRH